MATRLVLVLLLLALTVAIVAESSPSLFDAQWDVSRLSTGSGSGSGSDSDTGLIGDTIDPEEEMMLDSESTRRMLAGARYIGYGALKKNNVPCNRRGNSYYNCQQRGRANPYRRGCNAITRCARRV